MKPNAYMLGMAALAHRCSEEDSVTELDEQSASEVSDFAACAVAEASAADEQQMRSFENADGGRTVDGGGPPLQPALQPFAAVAPVPVGRFLQSEIPGVADENITLSGALAILHRCGPNGLKSWSDESARFPMTVALFERTNGIF